MDTEFLTIKAFAKLLGLHYNTVYLAVKSGRIDAFRITPEKKGAYRIHRSEINRIAEMDFRKKQREIIC